MAKKHNLESILPLRTGCVLIISQEPRSSPKILSYRSCRFCDICGEECSVCLASQCSGHSGHSGHPASIRGRCPPTELQCTVHCTLYRIQCAVQCTVHSTVYCAALSRPPPGGGPAQLKAGDATIQRALHCTQCCAARRCIIYRCLLYLNNRRSVKLDLLC